MVTGYYFDAFCELGVGVWEGFGGATVPLFKGFRVSGLGLGVQGFMSHLCPKPASSKSRVLTAAGMPFENYWAQGLGQRVDLGWAFGGFRV